MPQRNIVKKNFKVLCYKKLKACREGVKQLIPELLKDFLAY